MYIDIDERIAGKKDDPVWLLKGHPGPPNRPRIAKNAFLFHIVARIWKTGGYFFMDTS